MIVLDTHVWVWWVHGEQCLSPEQRDLLDAGSVDRIGVSIISCWEVSKLVEYGRLKLPQDVSEWLNVALAYPGVELLALTPAIVVESTRLPQPFHKDPADQLIVATARIHDCPLMTADGRHGSCGRSEYADRRLEPRKSECRNLHCQVKGLIGRLAVHRR